MPTIIKPRFVYFNQPSCYASRKSYQAFGQTNVQRSFFFFSTANLKNEKQKRKKWEKVTLVFDTQTNSFTFQTPNECALFHQNRIKIASKATTERRTQVIL